MRIAVVADSHFSERSRFEECVRVHDFIADEIIARDVDLVIHTGDVYDARSTPAERAAVVSWVRRVADRAPLLVVRGNHDAVGDLPLLERVRTRHQVRVEERVGTASFDTRAGRVVVGVLAWPQTAYLANALGHASLEHTQLAAGDAMRSVMRGLGAQLSGWSPDTTRIFAAHAMVRGSMTSTGQPLVGCDLEVGLDDIALTGADVAVLGHIHKPQSWDVDVSSDARSEAYRQTMRVIYPGSPRRTAFGEVESKGFLVLTIGERDGRGIASVDVETVATPCAPMHLVTGNYLVDEQAPYGGEPFTGLAHDGHRIEVAGAEIRFRYLVAADRREAAKVDAARFEAAWRSAGAAVVKVEEEVIAPQRARAPEIASAVTVADKLRALYARQGLDGERAERLIARAMEIERAA